MMSTSYLLCLLICCWFVDETLGTNPGLKIRLSQPGLNYAARVSVERLAARVQRSSLSDNTGEHHELKNMMVSEHGIGYSRILEPETGPQWPRTLLLLLLSFFFFFFFSYASGPRNLFGGIKVFGQV